MKLQLTILAAVLLTASAHMGVDPPTAEAGARTIVSVRISHDCGDDTVGTSNFTIVLPRRLPSVSVELMDHWRTKIHKKMYKVPLKTPVDGMNYKMEEYVSSVTYLGFLPDGFYQLFNMRIKMPEKPGRVLWFRGYQDCHNQGRSLAWATIPNAKNPSPRYPARNITVVKSLDE